MRCPVCQHDNAEGAKFCSECGTRLESRCPACSTPYETGAKFCSECGGSLQGATPPVVVDDEDDLARYLPEELLRKIRAAQSGQSMRGERRTVTMLFADIQGSTAAAEHLDPEEWADIINGAFGHLIEPVYRYEGTLARLQGDAILAFFGAPIAHEDDPVRAVRAGLDILADIRPYIAEVADRHRVDIDVRVGINTGLVVVGEVGSDLRVEYTALGDAINVAARMEQTADPGTIRVTDETLTLLGGVFAAEAIGPVDVKGKSEPVLAHRILGLADGGHRDGQQSTPLVGRTEELGALTAVVERLDDGLGAVCTLVGEAGIGKSRLLAAMRDRVSAGTTLARTWADDGELGWLRGRARSYERNVPHATFTDLLCDWWGRSSGDDCFDLIIDAVEAALGTRDEDVAGFLGHVIGAPLPPAQQQLVDSLAAPVLHERMTGAVIEYVRAESRRRPIVIVLDDLHWADAMTLTLVEALMDLCDSAPVALILVMRPNREDTAWRLIEVAGRDHSHLHTAIELEALPADATEELLRSLLAGAGVDARMHDDILERSNGNPLFVEEIVRSLGDDGGDQSATGGVDVPATLMSLLTARLDRLDDESRVIAQVASVIGREFDLDTLTAVIDVSGEPQARLRDLLRRGILEERRRVPIPTYSFRHPLIREAAFSTVLLRTRRELHGRIAHHLVDHATDAVEEIARHFVEAGLTEQAFPYLVEAGTRAIRAMALSDAISHFVLALESPPADAAPEQILVAHDGLGEAYSLVPDLTRASAAFQSLLDYGRKAGKPDIQVTALNRLGFSTAALSGDLDGAMIFLNQARDIAESAGDDDGLAEYHMNACFVTSMQGDLAQAVAHDDETARLGEASGNPQVRLIGLVRKAANLGAILKFDEAIEVAEEALRLAEELGDEELTATIKCNGEGFTRLLRGDLRGAAEVYSEQLPILDRFASYYAAFAHRWMAETALLAGDVERALAEYGAVERAGRQMGRRYAVATGLAGQARVLAMCGKTDEVEGLRAEALPILDELFGDFLAASVLADMGDARLAANTPGAEEDFTRALTVSSVSTQWERPRVLFGLARLALTRGDVAAAGEHLDTARQHVAQYGLRVHEPELLLLDGVVAVADGRPDDASLRFGEAVRSATESGRRLTRVEALRRLADLHHDNGDEEEAASLRDRARSAVDELAGAIVDDSLRTSFMAALRSEDATTGHQHRGGS